MLAFFPAIIQTFVRSVEGIMKSFQADPFLLLLTQIDYAQAC